jgi:hypothetical protein
MTSPRALIARQQRRDFLDSYVASGALTKEGKDWLVTALDPFHDYEVMPTGYPDAVEGTSIVVVTVSSKDITAPGAASGNWDCQIGNIPIIGGGAVNATVGTESPTGYAKINYQHTGLTASHVCPVYIRSADAGQTLWTEGTYTTWAPTNFASDVLTNAPDPATGHLRGRIVAWGIEVRNTTAEVYKQGACTSVVIPQEANRTQVYFTDVHASPWDELKAATTVYVQPPYSLAETTKYPSARQWNASEGSYMIIPVQRHNPYTAEDFSQVLLTYDGTPFSDTNSVTLTMPTQAGATATYEHAMRPCHVDTCLSYFTGLSNESTLTVVSKAFLEVLPTSAHSLLPLTSPSPRYDGLALKMYSIAMHKLDPIIPVTYNASGDWWRSVKQVLSYALPAVGTAIDDVLPGAGIAGKLAGAYMARSVAANEAARRTAKQRIDRNVQAPDRSNLNQWSKGRFLAKFGLSKAQWKNGGQVTSP